MTHNNKKRPTSVHLGQNLFYRIGSSVAVEPKNCHLKQECYQVKKRRLNLSFSLVFLFFHYNGNDIVRSLRFQKR